MKKLLSLILSAAMLASSTVIADDGEKKVINVAVNAEYAPFEYYEDGILKGFDIDVMNYIALKNGFEVNYIDMPFDNLVNAVNSGRADCAISSFTYTEERDAYVDFSTPYLIASVTSADGIREEKYSVIFRNFLSEAYLSGNSSTDAEKLFSSFEVTIGNMIHDGIINELIEKYSLDTATDTAERDYTYTTPTTYATSYDKVIYDIFTPSEWAEESIIAAAGLDITDADVQYLYPRAISREQFCELIYNYMTNVLNIQIEDFTNNFKDTDNEKIIALSSMGIINGKSEDSFAPTDDLTREEAAVILNRMINVTVPVPVTEMYFEFEDSEFISEWADSAVQVMCNMGVMNGVGNNSFAPLERYTVEQAIVTIMRIYEIQTRAEVNKD